MLLSRYQQDDPIPAVSQVLIYLARRLEPAPSLHLPLLPLPTEAVTCARTLLYTAQVQDGCLGKTLLRLDSGLL